MHDFDDELFEEIMEYAEDLETEEELYELIEDMENRYRARHLAWCRVDNVIERFKEAYGLA